MLNVFGRRGSENRCRDIEKFAQLLHYIIVEIVEIRPVWLEERLDVVGIIVEERRLAVCRAQCIPMLMAPVGVVGYYWGVRC